MQFFCIRIVIIFFLVNTSPFTIIDNLLETSKERESKIHLFQQVLLQQPYEPSENLAFLGGCCGL